MKNRFLFVLVVLIYLLLSELMTYFLQVDYLIKLSYLEKISFKQYEQLIVFQSNLRWIIYVISPLILLIKLLIVATIIYIGIAISEISLSFASLLKQVMRAEFIFLLIPVLKIVWFYFFQTNYTLEDIQNFYPLSALNITGYQGLDPWLIYPLQVLNLFELAYIIYLSYQIGKLTKTNTDNGLKIVAYSYVPAMFLWVTVVMFFTLNYS